MITSITAIGPKNGAAPQAYSLGLGKQPAELERKRIGREHVCCSGVHRGPELLLLRGCRHLHQSRRASRSNGLRHEDCRNCLGSKLQTRYGHAGLAGHLELACWRCGVAARWRPHVAHWCHTYWFGRAIHVPRDHAYESSAVSTRARSFVK